MIRRLCLIAMVTAIGWGAGNTPAIAAPALQQTWTCPSNWNANDCRVLQALYTSTDGPGWVSKYHWGTSAETWSGVTIGADGSVTELHFSMNHLTGTIPPELGNLVSLQRLTFYEGQLSGSIPPELGNLTHLEHLDLAWNQLNGSIPPELGNLTQLKYLDMGGNRLSGSIPLELGQLAQLEVLNLHGNQLSGSIPPELGNLTQLQELELSSNQLSGSIPPELGNLVHLEQLDLTTNQLTGNIPLELGNLTSLKRLILCDNQLTGNIPPELGHLTNLETMDLSLNQLSGSVPSEFGNLVHLSGMLLFGNRMSGPLPKWMDGNAMAGHPPIRGLLLHDNCGLTASNSAVQAFVESEDPDWQDSQWNCAALATMTAEGNMPTCGTSSLRPRLAINMTGRVLPGSPNNVRSLPSTTGDWLGQIPARSEFTILLGPICDQNIIWWRVSYGNLVGWTGEGRGTDYWLEPVSPFDDVEPATPVPPMACGGLISRLSIGQVGRVLSGDPNNLRDAPRPDAQWIGQISGGESFTVVDGPECSNDTLYWQVEYNGLTGWTGEGMNGVLWVEPVN